jgi:hypothetical protein
VKRALLFFPSPFLTLSSGPSFRSFIRFPYPFDHNPGSDTVQTGQTPLSLIRRIGSESRSTPTVAHQPRLPSCLPHLNPELLSECSQFGVIHRSLKLNERQGTGCFGVLEVLGMWVVVGIRCS